MAEGVPKGCDELGRTNDETRSILLSEQPQYMKDWDEDVVGPRGSGAGTTVASSSFTPARGGPSVNQTAHNHKSANDHADNRLATGSGGQSKVNCEGTRYIHSPPRKKKKKDRRKRPLAREPGKRGHKASRAGHAEARMIDDLFGAGKKEGQMTINIDWAPTAGGRSKMPCHHCHRMMCAAQHCGMEIYLCDEKGNKHRLEEGKHCPKKGEGPVTKGHYQNLEVTMGEAK
jgi:hypothetical protein